jgi:ferredoxin--NADP+ reductase
MEGTPFFSVAVIGAGPAGLFAARHLASQGAHVVLINRDIKPGGLAEYGIYPDKLKMKFGLRSQFHQVLDIPNIEYYGNLTVGEQGDLTLEQLRAMGFQAILVTVGAQGTKWLGLPGEDLTGTYHAKDIVYHYNNLPPFSEHQFQIGKRVAIIGAGNVMIDIAHWLIEEGRAEEILALVRRGPAEVKFDRKQLEIVAANLHIEALEREIERVTPIMLNVGQDPERARTYFHSAIDKAADRKSRTCFWIRFLSSPVAMQDDGTGRVGGLEIEKNTLALDGEEPRAVPLPEHRVYAVDTVIFAIGDQVDSHLGLPEHNHRFDKDPNPRFPVEGISYEVYDPEKGQPWEGFFVAGWARLASTGLVGIARRDGINGAQAVWEYLQTQSPEGCAAPDKFQQAVTRLGHPVVTKEALATLEAVEQQRGRDAGLEDFKFSSNRDMLEAMGLMGIVQ